jgi:hypothetical protein
MSTTKYKSVTGSIQDRPDLTIFKMRAIVFGVLLLFAHTMFVAKVGHWYPLKWFLFFNIRIILIIILFYNILYLLKFKWLKYILTDQSLEIVTFPNKIIIKYSDIKSIQHVKDSLDIIKPNLWNPLIYYKEAPQVCDYIAQVGTFKLSGTEDVFFASTEKNLQKPEHLLMVETKDRHKYCMSPEKLDDFIFTLQSKLDSKEK